MNRIEIELALCELNCVFLLLPKALKRSREHLISSAYRSVVSVDAEYAFYSIADNIVIKLSRNCKLSTVRSSYAQAVPSPFR